MKIGIFDPYLDDLGGGEKYMMTIATCLSQKHEVTVFWDRQEDIQAITKRFGISFEKINVYKNIFSPHVNFFERNKMYRNFDAIIVLSDGSIPLVFPSKLFLHIQQPLSHRRKLSLKEKIKLKYVSAIFYNSSFTQKYNETLFKNVKNMVIYPPVALGNREQGLWTRGKDNVIVHVGRFRVKNIPTEDYKKQGFMIEAFKKLVDSGLKNWKFILASSVKDKDKESFEILKKNAEGYPIEFKINNTNQELFALYNKAKIYWHASGYGEDLEKNPELAEHFGITTVEAMGSGAVPVVINSGGQREIITDGKNGLLWNSLEEFIEKTKQLAHNEKQWKELSEQAIIRAHDFSEEQFSIAINQLVTK